MDFLGIGWEEVLLILVIALLIFGPNKVVEIGRTLGKAVNAFKKATSEFSSQITAELDKPKNESLPEKKEENQHSDRVS